MARKRRPRREQVYSIQSGMPADAAAEPYFPKVLYPDRVEDDASSELLPAFHGWIGRLKWRFAIDRGIYVDWAIMLDVFREDEPNAMENDGIPRSLRHVERIDCCDSEIHRHIFTINSPPDDNDGQRAPLRTLTAGDASIVNQEFDHYFEMIALDWQERVRRWRNG